MKTLLTLLIILVVAGSCQQDKIQEEKNKIIDLDEKSAKLVEADNAFGLEVFRKTREESDEENIMISPLSISVALAMAYNGADGDTKTEMEAILKLNGLTIEQINASYQSLIAALQSLDEDVVFELANAIFYTDGFAVKNDFLNVNENIYDAGIEQLDFNSPSALETINGWVAEKTHDKILSIIDWLSPNDLMVLLNAVYFNGIWSTQFEEEGTHMLPFYKTDGSETEVAMMNKEDKLDYISNNLFSAIKMPYGNGQYNMLVLLPANGKNSQEIIDELSSENWKNWNDNFETKDHVVVTMPRFKFAFKLEMKEVLKNMGMKKAFIPHQADFSKIADISNLHIGEVIHKSFIDVNETGTEAAAVTAIVIRTTSTGPGEQVQKIYFTVDKPFLFAITEKDTGAILFIGEVNNPEYD